MIRSSLFRGSVGGWLAAAILAAVAVGAMKLKRIYGRCELDGSVFAEDNRSRAGFGVSVVNFIGWQKSFHWAKSACLLRANCEVI